MKFLIALFALAAVASAQTGGGNYVFRGDHGYHQQSFNIQGGGASAVTGGRRSGGYSSGGYSSGVSRGAALGGNVQLVALVPVQAQHTNIRSHAVASHSAQSSGPVYAAVQSTRNVQYVDGPSAEPAQAQTIIIGPSVQPLDFEFQSQSSPINVRQSHIPGQPGAPQESSHTEEPDVLRQTITKPLIHEVHEEITPVRRISQVVNPVQEEINQQITRGQQVQTQQVQRQQVAVAAQAVPVQTIQLAAVQPVQQQQAQLGTIAIIGGLQGLSGLSGLSGSSGYTLGGSGLSGLTLGGSGGGYSSGYSTGGLSSGGLSSFGNSFRGYN